jgi:hypothetical protein
MAQNIAEKRKVMIERMKEGLKNKGIGNYNVYLTNYGFGVCNLFGNGIEEAKNVISTCGIEFKKIEYSDAHWVVRVIL